MYSTSYLLNITKCIACFLLNITKCLVIAPMRLDFKKLCISPVKEAYLDFCFLKQAWKPYQTEGEMRQKDMAYLSFLSNVFVVLLP